VSFIVRQTQMRSNVIEHQLGKQIVIPRTKHLDRAIHR